jgi:hypothetical protein
VSGGEWLGAAKSRPLVDVAAGLGLSVRRDRAGPCPACGAESENRVRRPPVGILRSGGWCCNSCGAAGDGPDLVAWKLTGGPSSGLDRDGWRAVREWFGGGPGRPVEPSIGRALPPPDYPPVGPLAGFWCGLVRFGAVTGAVHPPVAPPEVDLVDFWHRWAEEGRPPFWESAETGRAAVASWLVSRGILPDMVALLDLVRVAPRTSAPLWKGGPLAPGWPWCAVLPLVDATGLVRSVLFRAVADPPPDLPAKSRALAGYARVGLVLADPMALALLSRQPGRDVSTDGVPWSGLVHVCEGEPDYLTLAAHPSRVTDGASYAVLGWLGSGGLPEEVAARIPTSTEVHVWPHRDEAGEGAALRTVDRLAHVTTIKKRRVDLA